jgi:hypothetical protein
MTHGHRAQTVSVSEGVGGEGRHGGSDFLIMALSGGKKATDLTIPIRDSAADI